MVPSLTAADTVELPLPTSGRLHVRTLPRPHGRARYVVRGGRVHGTLVMIPHTAYDGPVRPKRSTPRPARATGVSACRTASPEPTKLSHEASTATPRRWTHAR